MLAEQLKEQAKAPRLNEYRLFLTWFEEHYRRLNKEYRQYITIPKPGEGVKVTSTSLNPAMFAQLQQVEYEYTIHESSCGNKTDFASLHQC